MPDRATHFRNLTGQNARGQATEAILKPEFLVRGITIATPEYDNEPYDFLIETGDGLYRVQAKTAYQESEGTVQFETLRTSSRADGYDRRDYEGEIDFFSVYNPVMDECYLIPEAESPAGKMTIRFRETSNNQESGVNWNTEFILDKALERISK